MDSEQFLAWLLNSGVVWLLLVVVLFVRWFFWNYSLPHTINSRSLKCFPRNAEPFSTVVMQPWPCALFLSSTFSPSSPLKTWRCILLEQELCISQSFCSMKYLELRVIFFVQFSAAHFTEWPYMEIFLWASVGLCMHCLKGHSYSALRFYTLPKYAKLLRKVKLLTFSQGLLSWS